MTTPRRLVLMPLADEPAVVLADPPAAKLHAEIRRLADEYHGRRIAAEHLTVLGWVRWIIASDAPDPEYFSKEEPQ